MPAFSASVVIPASVSAVFEVVSDLTTHPRWAADELTMTRTGEMTWRSVSRAKGRVFHADLIVIDVRSDRSFEFVASDETGTYGHRFSLREAPGGCELTRTVTARQLRAGQQALYWVTLLPVRKPAMRVSLQRLASLFA